MKKLLAVNDERDHCERCGRSDLRRVAWIEDTDTGYVGTYGTTCAARVLGRTNHEQKTAEDNMVRKNGFTSVHFCDFCGDTTGCEVNICENCNSLHLNVG